MNDNFETLYDFSDDRDSIAIDTPEGISLFRLMTLRKGLQLEKKGLRISRGRSCLTIVKKEFGWKGNREKIIGLLDDVIGEMSTEYHGIYNYQL